MNINTNNRNQPVVNMSSLSSKWANCFISLKSHSQKGLTFADSNDRQLLPVLIADYLHTHKLKIFVSHFHTRHPRVYGSKCGMPMTSILINQESYFVDNEFYIRNLSHVSNEILLTIYWDWLWIFSYLRDHYYSPSANAKRTTPEQKKSQNNKEKDKDYSDLQWILLLEDDVSFCPDITQTMLNVMDERKNTGKNAFSWIFLGHGATGTMLRVSFLPAILVVLSHYIADIARHGFVQPIERYAMRWGFGRYKDGINGSLPPMIATADVLLFHPASSLSKSTLDHNFPGNFICHEPSSWRIMWEVVTVDSNFTVITILKP